MLALKKHIFYGKHSLPLADGQGMELRRFSAHDEIAYAWQLAMKGELSDAQKGWFRTLADHELAERAFMAQGIPYHTLESYNPSTDMFERIPAGAHDLAPPHAPYGSFPGFQDWYWEFFK